jgi:hypothetical protein
LPIDVEARKSCLPHKDQIGVNRENCTSQRSRNLAALVARMVESAVGLYVSYL